MCQIQKFLHKQLKLRNLCCRRIPYELTSEQKRNLLKYNRGRLNVAYDSVAGNETWMYCDIPERKRQSTVKIFEGDSKLLKKIREAKVPNNFYVFLKIQDLM